MLLSVQPLFFRETSDSRLTVLTQLTGLVFGALCISIAFTVESLGGVLTAALTIIPVVGGPMLGLFTLGMFSTAVEERVLPPISLPAPAHPYQTQPNST